MNDLFPPILRKLNIVQRDKGAFAALLGEAHQYLVTGILMRLGFLVSVITVRAGTYDIIIPAFEDFVRSPEKTVLLRAQVKTIKKSLRFIGGTRAGVDRIYIPGAKEYKYTAAHNDLIIGIDVNTLDLYFLPTQFIYRWGKSVSKNKLELLRNNVDILLNWNEDFLVRLKGMLPK
ncbi:MAG: hypothetical protein QXI12_13450 [Candidatus Methanomethyliaceae archaeon]